VRRQVTNHESEQHEAAGKTEAIPPHPGVPASAQFTRKPDVAVRLAVGGDRLGRFGAHRLGFFADGARETRRERSSIIDKVAARSRGQMPSAAIKANVPGSASISASVGSSQYRSMGVFKVGGLSPAVARRLASPGEADWQLWS
jgi:hypothetical protein